MICFWTKRSDRGTLGVPGARTGRLHHLTHLAVSGFKEEPRGTLTQNTVSHKKLGRGQQPGCLTPPSAWTPTRRETPKPTDVTCFGKKSLPPCKRGPRQGRDQRSQAGLWSPSARSLDGSSQAGTTVNRGETGCRGVGAEGAKSSDVCRKRVGGGGGRETPGC